ncbi:hypothetical protein OGAPHI_003856 [Ogataea philodendri]|uniref:Uncharacterized protein n=1 Tax=Ogataea philodendri TaxID=1378263 RepID=A0A9P8P549_9ASCO|nr:uncharacterized protein OGAPHI_003856 [Ogataea philodendri]KAH3665668.1 hypothetical protein OGAPHI_003856 [Ogataea philodendri]
MFTRFCRGLCSRSAGLWYFFSKFSWILTISITSLSLRSFKRPRNCFTSSSLSRSKLVGSSPGLPCRSIVARPNLSGSRFKAEVFLTNVPGNMETDGFFVSLAFTSGSEYLLTDRVTISVDPDVFRSTFFRALGLWFNRGLSKWKYGCLPNLSMYG